MAITTDNLKPSNFDHSVTGVADGQAWTKSDTNYFSKLNGKSDEIPFISKAISVSISGVYRIRMTSGNLVDTYLAAGILHPIHAKQVHSTSSAAGNVVVWE